MSGFSDDWREDLRTVAEKSGVSLVRFNDEEWSQLKQSRFGGREFTIARHHETFEGIKARSLCLVAGREGGDLFQLYVGVLSTKQAITTLETRIKIRRLQLISPHSESEFAEITGLENRGTITESSIVRLSKKRGGSIVQALAALPDNEEQFHSILDAVRDVDPRAKNRSLQLDAIQTVLRVFDTEVNAEAALVEIKPQMDTALDGTNIQEANVILHDSRVILGYSLESSDITGRAIFVKGDERLEVITANALPLEEVFGVDLIYLNRISKNIVMVQYKMLDRLGSEEKVRWQHRVTPQMHEEIDRMHQFRTDVFPSCDGYRLNSDPFYFKFVKRERTEGTRGLVLPLEHFERILAGPEARGPNDGFRVDYDSLSGQYLRQTAFIELIRSGYIGSTPIATEAFEKLIKYVTENGKSAVIAIRSLIKEAAE
ncbi:MAG: hypothetical protein Q7U82_12485 [Gammaproteobacteria bacterium]|nr:hypothetical protein [Gammaproteobacteria bacterium]